MIRFKYSLNHIFSLATTLMIATTGCAGLTSTNAEAQNATAENVQNTTANTASANSKSSGSTSSGTSFKVDDIADTTEFTQPSAPTTAEQNQQNQFQQVIDESAQTLNQAQTALNNGGNAQGFKLAIASYKAFPTKDALDTALYAASRLTPIELLQLDKSAETHAEQAIIGQLRLNICAAQNDQNCIRELLPRTIQSLEMIGDQKAADRLRNSQSASAASHPIASAFLPLSGSDRKIGRAMLGAMLQAAGIYNHNALPFDLRVFDTQTSAQSADSLLSESRNIGAKLILGPIDIRESNAVAQKLDDNEVMISFCPNDNFIKNNDRVFQFSYGLTQEAEQIAQFAVSTNAARIAVFAPDDPYAQTFIEQLKASLPSSTQVTALTFPANRTDLKSDAGKIAKSTPDIIFLPTTPDVAERIASFMAQENVWCQTPGTPAPKTSTDTRKFTTCIAPSAWGPIANNHGFKFITNAIYLDYTEAVTRYSTDFAAQFESLYHRQPSVQEVLPFMAISMLQNIPSSAWQSADSLKNAVKDILRGQRFLMMPGFRQVTTQSSQTFILKSNTQNSPDRTLVTAK